MKKIQNIVGHFQHLTLHSQYAAISSQRTDLWIILVQNTPSPITISRREALLLIYQKYLLQKYVPKE